MAASSTTPNLEPIAVVGLSALFPGSTDAAGFWRDILSGRDLLQDIPETHWLVGDYYDPDPTTPDRTYAKRGAFLPKVGFDPLAFGIPPKILSATDTAQLLALIVAKRVLDDACQGQFEDLDRERVSVILGVTGGQQLLGLMASRLQRPVWVKALRDIGLPESQVQQACESISSHYPQWQESTFPGLLGNVVAGRIANRFGLHGANFVTDAACASTFSALNMAVNELRLGHADMVISGGVDTSNDAFMFMCFSKTPALSKSGDCRPFSDQADGTMLGEGLGMVALKRLSDAERDDDRIYAVIRGVGASSDGRSKSVYAPVPEGQARAMRRAYSEAGYGPETVELVEAHGTGTTAGDKAEFEGLRQVFAPTATTTETTPWCALGSIKSQIGHTKAAAGAAGLFKAVMALHHKILPPTTKIERPNPGLHIDESPFYLNTQTRPWVRGSDHPRRASVSSFGFGGSNFHVALEEYTDTGKQAWRTAAAPTELVLFDAPSAAELLSQLDGFAPFEHPDTLQYLARTSQERYSVEQSAGGARLAIVASTLADLVDKVAAARMRITEAPQAAFAVGAETHYATQRTEGHIAFLFPGQGSQFLNMGADLAMHFPQALASWDVAAKTVRDDQVHLGEVVFPPPVFTAEALQAQDQRLRQTQWAQPALGAASLAQLAILDDLGIKAGGVGGHSFGEVAALYAGGCFDAETMLNVARKRGELMHLAAQRPGAMLAVLASEAKVRALIDDHKLDIVVANVNSPKQTVVAGTTTAIGIAEKALKEAKLRHTRLPVATAFHSPVVADATTAFAAFLETVACQPSTIPIFANSTAAAYDATAESVRQTLASQIAAPVRFLDMIDAMYTHGARTFIEVGAGNVLSSLVGRILGDRPHNTVACDRKGKHGITTFQCAIAQLAALGIPMKLDRLWSRVRPLRNPAEQPQPKLSFDLCGANYGNPYPPVGGEAALPQPNPEAPQPASAQPTVERDPATTPALETPVHPAPRPTQATAPHAARKTDSSHIAPTPRTETSMQEQPTPPATMPTPTAPSTPAAAPASQAWLDAFQTVQRQSAEAHASWQNAMADAHQTYLRTVERSLAGLQAMATGSPVPSQPLPERAPLAQAPALIAPPPNTPASAAQLWQAPTPPPSVGASPAPPPATAAPAAPAQATGSLDLANLLLEVIAEKTGYPADMLNMDMNLEADLGIDSIKRVEILSAMSDQVTDLPELDTAALGALQTLGEIATYLRAQLGTPEQTGNPTTQIATATTDSDLDAAALQKILLDVVADKTGYPADMLNMDMNLEADLGIDSIKRVEILSAMSDQVTDLPELDTAALGALQTLGEIVKHLRGHMADHMDDQTKTAVSSATQPDTIAEATPTTTIATTDPISRAVLALAPAPAPGLALPKIAPGCHWQITNDGSELPQALADCLTVYGFRTTLTDEPDATANAVILFPTASDCALSHRDAFLTAQALAPNYLQRGGVFVTVQDTGGDFGLSGQGNPTGAGLAALAKTAALEWPQATIKAIDLARSDRTAAELARAIAVELLHGGNAAEVGLGLDGRRFVPLTQAQPLDTTAPLPLAENDVVVVSGGARGVTAACVCELAKTLPLRFVLLGRSKLSEEPEELRSLTSEQQLTQALAQTGTAPRAVRTQVQQILRSREIRATLTAIREAGSEVRYEVVNVTDALAVSQILAGVRENWGPIAAVVHGAGVLADKLIVDKTAEQFERVFATKVGGAQALIDATATDPLKVLCLFSSVAARSGNAGQSDYAMANDVLNKMAHSEANRRPGCIVKSLGWGPWAGGMVNPALAAHFAARNVTLIDLADGARRFVDELREAETTEILIGAPLRAPAAGTEHEALVPQHVWVDDRNYGFLTDHAIDGDPVVPVALAAEWFTRALRLWWPDHEAIALHDVRVLKGIRLAKQNQQPVSFTLTATQASERDDALTLALLGPNGQPHYRATALRCDATALSTPIEAPSGLEPWVGCPYETETLFHGPAFYIIDKIDGVGTNGLTAKLHSVSDLPWTGGPWCLDAAALDGALQAALLWTQHTLGGRSLPTSIGRLLHNGRPLAGPVHCNLRQRATSKNRALCDIALADQDGSVFAVLEGVETHLLPEPAAHIVTAR